MKRLGIRVAAMLGVLGLLWPTQATASRVLVVVRGVGAGADKAASYASHFLSESFAEDPRYEAVDLVHTLGDSDQHRAVRAFRMAEEMTEKGRAAYESLELDPAVEYLTAALSKYERNAGYATDLKRVADTLMMLGATHILRGEDKTGVRRLSQAITTYPEVKPDPRVFNPSMRKIFKRASDRLMQRPRGAFTISSNPSYSAVYVDGAFAGVTPLTVPDLTEGRHFVHLQKDGYRNWGRVLDIEGGNEAAETATLKPTKHLDDYDVLADAAVRRVSEGTAQGAIDDAVDQIGALANADYVLVGSVRLDGDRVELGVHLFDLNGRREVNRARHVFSYDTAPQTYRREVGQLVRTHFGGGEGEGEEGPVEPVPPAPSTPAGPASDTGAPAASATAPPAVEARCMGSSCQAWKKWALVGGGGGGALLMGAGGALWALASSDNSTFGESVQLSGAATAVKRAGKRKALAGDILFGTGLVAALASLGVYFFWPSDWALDDDLAGADHGLELGATPLPGGGALVGAWRF